jgi:hypothetical protein
MKRIELLSLLALGWLTACSAPQEVPAPGRVKTTFQSSQPWKPTIDNRADAVMV